PRMAMAVGEEQKQPFHFYARASLKQDLQPTGAQVGHALDEGIGLIEALAFGQLVEQFEDCSLLARITDRKAHARGADHDWAWLGRHLGVAREQPQAVVPAEGHVERQVAQPCRRALGPIKMNLAQRCREVMGIALLLERGSSAYRERKVQHGL